MQKFRTSFSGYNKDDVKSFVDEVIKEYEDILIKLRESTKEMEYLNKELTRYKSLEKSLNDALLVAHESSATAQRAAINEGKLIIEEARKRANSIVNTSLERSQNIELAAEELKRKIINYKRRFTALVESQLDEVNALEERL